jgi:pimeloyl-ACP methyl ester carboxylesterase
MTKSVVNGFGRDLYTCCIFDSSVKRGDCEQRRVWPQSSCLDVIDSISGELRVVMPDLPAFGVSEAPASDCSMDYYVDFLSGFTKGVDLDRFFLMDTSMGANIAVHYAAAYPDQMQGLIFLRPFGLHDRAGRMIRIKGWNAFPPQIRQPVLILIGSEDKLISPEDRDLFCTFLADKRLEIEIIEDSGHFLYLDAPGVVSDKIVSFTRGGT